MMPPQKGVKNNYLRPEHAQTPQREILGRGKLEIYFYGFLIRLEMMMRKKEHRNVGTNMLRDILQSFSLEGWLDFKIK